MAEPDVMTQVENIIKCTMCKELLIEPKTLSCLHSYCSDCITNKELTTKGRTTGYECNACHRITPKDDVRTMNLVVHLLDVNFAEKQSQQEIKCNHCENVEAKWCCTDCATKNKFCDACKTWHDKFMNHHVITIEELQNGEHAFEKPMYCSEHKDNKIEVFCTQCEKTMCVLCKIFKHDGHEAEPTDKALQRILPELITKKELVEEYIKENTMVVDRFKTEIHEAVESCDSDKEKLKTKLDEDISKLKAKYQADCQDLEAKKTENIKEFEKGIQDYNFKLNEQKQGVAFVDTTITRTKGTTMLHHIQDGLLEKVKKIALDPDNGKFSASRVWPWTKPRGTLTCQKSIQVPITNTNNYYASGHGSKNNNPYTRLCILWETLWLINTTDGRVDTYSFDGKPIGTVNFSKDINQPRVAIEISNTKWDMEAVLVAKSGLFIINQQGQITSTLQQGDFSDACLARDRILYAFEQNKGHIVLFIKIGDAWQQLREVMLQNYKTENKVSGYEYTNTIVVEDKHIYVAMVYSNKINCYDMIGTKIREIGNLGTKLVLPSICGMDKENNILIANPDNQYLQWLDNNGAVVQTDNFKSYPRFAAYQNDMNLWVLSGNGSYSSQQNQQFPHRNRNIIQSLQKYSYN